MEGCQLHSTCKLILFESHTLFLLEYNCFILLCHFQRYNRVNMYMAIHIHMKGCCYEISAMPEFLASGGEEFSPGPVTRLDRSELFV